MRSFVCVAVCLLGLAFENARGMFLRPELEPVDRLVKNAESYAESHPSDAAAQYTLARIHYLAFALRIDAVPCFPPNEDGQRVPAPDHLVGLPVEMARRNRAIEKAREELGLKGDKGEIPSDPEKIQKYWQTVTRITDELTKENWTPPALPNDALLKHADRAAQLFHQATQLDAKNGLYPLGYGSLMLQVADWLDSAKIETLPESLKLDQRAAARSAFLKAWNLSFPTDSKSKSLPPSGLPGMVSHEAGRGFVQLCEATSDKLTAEEKAALPKVRAGLEKLEKLPQTIVTPLVLALTSVSQLSDLLQPGSAVEFDLRGFGHAERWEWIKPELGLLVWDPLDRREVRSGRQLFGHYTFRIFRDNGYEALASLDDNADGKLSGLELDGIAVWFDRNGDGVSSREEVVPVHELGVQALECRATSRDERHLMNSRGVRFSDGRELPTWDWMPRAAELAP
jgi:hypothetical protein